MHRVLYITASQFSGTTLAAFLLNTHPEIATVGHAGGWHFGADEEFLCSCGAALDRCPFYAAIAADYEAAGLPFSIRDFGTAYELADSDRGSRLLAGPVPLLANQTVERWRDAIVRAVPAWRRKLDRIDRSNATFIGSALRYSGASVFLDNSQDPYRAQHLSRIPALQVHNLHLLRDPRGTVHSMMRRTGWDAGLSMRLWLRRQSDIVRIGDATGVRKWVRYEALCSDTDATLRDIHRFAAIAEQPFTGDFKSGEHHILGNDMRFGGGEIRLDERWRRELEPADRKIIEAAAGTFIRKQQDHGLSAILRSYLDAEPA